MSNEAWLPPPEAFQLPSKFTGWRTHQPAAILSILDSEQRFMGLTAPVGSGKSLVAVAAAIISGKRLLYLTSTKGLQAQLLRDFANVGIVDIRGRNNYSCEVDRGLGCDQGPCVAGLQCELRSECQYWRAVKKARQAQVVVTNYSYWMASQGAGIELGKFDILVADEAHSGDEVVSRFLEVGVRREDMPQFWPGNTEQLSKWQEWASAHRPAQSKLVEDMGEAIRSGVWTPRKIKEYVRARGVLDSLEKVAMAGDDWVVEPINGGERVTIGPVWPKQYTESALWRGVGLVVPMSATLNHKTMELLGVGEYKLAEYPHTFPLANRLMTHIRTGVKLNFRSTDVEIRKILRTMDHIIDRRLDRNGLVHTVSYARRDLVMRTSRHAELFMTHSRRDTERRVMEFKKLGRERPVVLVSPVITTGYDFPGREAEYQVIMKVPYPDTTGKLVAARCKQDDEYAAYVAMMDLVQTSGRIVRSETDVGETLIIDDTIGWFMGRFAKKMAPKWFRDAYVHSDGIPDPPKRGEEE